MQQQPESSSPEMEQGNEDKENEEQNADISPSASPSDRSSSPIPPTPPPAVAAPTEGCRGGLLGVRRSLIGVLDHRGAALSWGTPGNCTRS